MGFLWISKINWCLSSLWWVTIDVAEVFVIVTLFHFQVGEHKRDGQ